MRLSTRNQLAGTVASIETGAVMDIVKVRLDGGQLVTASVTKEAVEELGLSEGTPVSVLVKSTEVMIGVELGRPAALRARRSQRGGWSR